MRLALSTKGALLAASLALVPAVLGLAAQAGNARSSTRLDQTIGYGSVVGFIQTDGGFGVLGASDITSWNLNLNGDGASFDLTPLNSHVLDRGIDVTATATDLFFDFSGADNGRLLFQTGAEDGEQYYCDSTSNSDCDQGATVTPITISDPSAQNVAESGNQIIGVAGVPEPASWAMLLMGVAGVGAALRRRTERVATA